MTSSHSSEPLQERLASDTTFTSTVAAAVVPPQQTRSNTLSPTTPATTSDETHTITGLTGSSELSHVGGASTSTMTATPSQAASPDDGDDGGDGKNQTSPPSSTGATKGSSQVSSLPTDTSASEYFQKEISAGSTAQSNNSAANFAAPAAQEEASPPSHLSPAALERAKAYHDMWPQWMHDIEHDKKNDKVVVVLNECLLGQPIIVSNQPSTSAINHQPSTFVGHHQNLVQQLFSDECVKRAGLIIQAAMERADTRSAEMKRRLALLKPELTPEACDSKAILIAPAVTAVNVMGCDGVPPRFLEAIPDGIRQVRLNDGCRFLEPLQVSLLPSSVFRLTIKDCAPKSAAPDLRCPKTTSHHDGGRRGATGLIKKSTFAARQVGGRTVAA